MLPLEHQMIVSGLHRLFHINLLQDKLVVLVLQLPPEKNTHLKRFCKKNKTTKAPKQQQRCNYNNLQDL